MPYKLRKSPGKEAYWVVTKSTGRKHSKSPLPKQRALAQMRALYAVENGYVLRNKSLKRKAASQMRKSLKRK